MYKGYTLSDWKTMFDRKISDLVICTNKHFENHNCYEYYYSKIYYKYK